MKFRRKSAEPVDGALVEDGPADGETTVPAATGPWDVDDLPGGLEDGRASCRERV